jgi:hypothetical protein
MFGEIVRPREAFLAEPTRERLLAGVAALVLAQILLGSKGQLAAVTGIGPLPGVDSRVDTQKGRPRKLLEASWTTVGLPGKRFPETSLRCITQKYGQNTVSAAA